MNSMMMISNVFLLLTRSLASAHRIGQVLEAVSYTHLDVYKRQAYAFRVRERNAGDPSVQRGSWQQFPRFFQKAEHF